MYDIFYYFSHSGPGCPRFLPTRASPSQPLSCHFWRVLLFFGSLITPIYLSVYIFIASEGVHRMRKEELQHEVVLGTQVKQYYLHQQLGSGATARVYLAINQQSNREVAVKVIPKQYINADKKIEELVRAEILIMKKCHNKNVIQFYDVMQSSRSLFIVMEYCNGPNMEDYVMKKKKYLSEDNSVMYMKQILNGFKGLHQQNAMHRDFKLSNLLLHNRVCKIADLGFAKQVKEGDLTDTIVGTVLTMAPEVLERKAYGIKADVWSLGVVFYNMLTGKYPFVGRNNLEMLRIIKNINEEIFNIRASWEAIDFLRRCLTYDPAARIGWEEIYEHPLFNKKSIELMYGFERVEEAFKSNQQFYKSQKMSQNHDESFESLRNTARMELIINQVELMNERANQYKNALRSSIEMNNMYELMLKYGITFYGSYLNQLCCSMKFIDYRHAFAIPGVESRAPIYLIYKKAVSEMAALEHSIHHKKNCFKIVKEWGNFVESEIYQNIGLIAADCLQRMYAIYSKVEAEVAKLVPGTLTDPRLHNQLKQKKPSKASFPELLDQYTLNYAQELREYIQKGGNVTIESVEVFEGLLFFLQKVDKDKPNPERFEWHRSTKVEIGQYRKQVLAKYDQIMHA